MTSPCATTRNQPRELTWSYRTDASPESAEVALLDLLRGGSVRLVVNTPTPRSGAVRDAAEIRHTAVAEGVPCLTAIETAVAAAEALDPDVDARVADVRPLDVWVPAGPPREGRVREPAAAGVATR